MRSRISIRGCVRPSVGPSVRPSVGPSHTSWISEKWAEFEQNSIRNEKVSHLKDDSKTSTWAVRQRTHLLSELCSTCFCCILIFTFSLFTFKKLKFPPNVASVGSNLLLQIHRADLPDFWVLNLHRFDVSRNSHHYHLCKWSQDGKRRTKVRGSFWSN